MSQTGEICKYMAVIQKNCPTEWSLKFLELLGVQIYPIDDGLRSEIIRFTMKSKGRRLLIDPWWENCKPRTGDNGKNLKELKLSM